MGQRLRIQGQAGPSVCPGRTQSVLKELSLEAQTHKPCLQGKVVGLVRAMCTKMTGAQKRGTVQDWRLGSAKKFSRKRERGPLLR